MGAGSGRCVRWRSARENLAPEVGGSRDADCFADYPLNPCRGRDADAGGSQETLWPRAEKARDTAPFVVGTITVIPILSRRRSMIPLSLRSGSTVTLPAQLSIDEPEAAVKRWQTVGEEEEVDDEGGKKGRSGDDGAKARHHRLNSRWRRAPHGQRRPHAMQLPSSATAMQVPLRCS